MDVTYTKLHYKSINLYGAFAVHCVCWFSGQFCSPSVDVICSCRFRTYLRRFFFIGIPLL